MTYPSLLDTPSLLATAFNCPYCDAYANQDWYLAYGFQIFPNEADVTEKNLKKIDSDSSNLKIGIDTSPSAQDVVGIRYSVCCRCKQLSVWKGVNLILPPSNLAPPASEDMSVNVRKHYNEAASIFCASPRGAAALLRLALEELCKELGEPSKNISDNIASFVKKGLNNKVQKALDAIRVIGNEAVHPGQFDFNDDQKTAEALFALMNFIVEKMVTEPSRVEEVFAKLPTEKREAIDQRDRKQKQSG